MKGIPKSRCIAALSEILVWLSDAGYEAGSAVAGVTVVLLVTVNCKKLWVKSQRLSELIFSLIIRFPSGLNTLPLVGSKVR